MDGGAITNAGSINGAVEVYTGFTLVNAAAASIYAPVDAVLFEGPATFTNAGAITSAGYGIVLKDGGSVTNLTSGLIQSGVYDGIDVLAAAGSVGNAGTIITTDSKSSAIYFYAAGSVTNTGVISSAFHGVKAPRASATVSNAGTITDSNAGYSAIALDAGGTVTNTAGGTIMAAYHGVYILGGGTVINAGTIGATGAFGAVDLVGGFNNRVIVDPGAVFQGQVQGGQNLNPGTVSVLELASGGAGTLAGIGSSFVNFGSIQLDPGAAWTLSGSAAGLAGGQPITGFVPGDTIVLTGVTASATTLSNGTLSLSDGHSLLFPGTAYTFGEFSTTNTGGNTDITVACFRAGARVLTDRGEVAAKALQPGMHVVSLTHRRAVAARWVGARTLQRTPVVCIAAGAFGDGAPHRALHLSPDHAVFVDGALVPVRYLVNGASIAEFACDEVTYVHVELAAHAVLLAEGLPAESYLDTGNRAAFDDVVSEPSSAPSSTRRASTQRG